MKCQRCGTDNPAGSGFCNTCGASLADSRPSGADTDKLVEDFAGLARQASRMDLMRNARLLLAGALVFIVAFVAAIILSIANSAIGSFAWVALMVLLLALTLMTTRSMVALRFIAPLMILIAVVAAATDMGGNDIFNRLSTPIICRDMGDLKVEKRVQTPYAGKVVTEYVFFCQQEGAEWRMSAGRVFLAHSVIYGGLALLLLVIFIAVALLSRARAQPPPRSSF